MQTVTTMIYRGAQSPVMEGDAFGTCRTCGLECVGLLFEKWVKDTFTDRDKLRPGEIVCHACLFCFAEQSELLRQMFSKEKPQRFRNYSHFVVDGAWYPLTKGQKAQMRELLFQSPPVAIIAESGQKHLAFRAQTGWWQFEEQRMLPDVEGLKTVLTIVETLYNAGANKGEIESGEYRQFTIMQIGLSEWQEQEAKLKHYRGSLLFLLALFLAQKENEDGTSTDS